MTHYIECSVRSSEGDFETTIKIPAECTAEQFNEFLHCWFQSMEAACTYVGMPKLKDEDKMAAKSEGTTLPQSMRPK